MSEKKKTILILCLSIFLYILSLFFNGFRDNRNGEIPGALLMVLGWQQLQFMGSGIIWLANPLLWYSWIRINKNLHSLIACLASTILSISFLFVTTLNKAYYYEGSDFIEAGYVDAEVLSYEAGYYLWLASSVVMLLWKLYIIYNRK